MHARQIIHQDVHFANVLCSEDGLSWKLADLGNFARNSNEKEANGLPITSCGCACYGLLQR